MKQHIVYNLVSATASSNLLKTSLTVNDVKEVLQMQMYQKLWIQF